MRWAIYNAGYVITPTVGTCCAMQIEDLPSGTRIKRTVEVHPDCLLQRARATFKLRRAKTHGLVECFTFMGVVPASAQEGVKTLVRGYVGTRRAAWVYTVPPKHKEERPVPFSNVRCLEQPFDKDASQATSIDPILEEAVSGVSYELHHTYSQPDG